MKILYDRKLRNFFLKKVFLLFKLKIQLFDLNLCSLKSIINKLYLKILQNNLKINFNHSYFQNYCSM